MQPRLVRRCPICRKLFELASLEDRAQMCPHHHRPRPRTAAMGPWDYQNMLRYQLAKLHPPKPFTMTDESREVGRVRRQIEVHREQRELEASISGY